MENKLGYCPLCDKEIEIITDANTTVCPICGHHISLHTRTEEEKK